MRYIVGSARHDERGKYVGGVSGDQTGEEVSEQEMYNHSKGWVCLRAKNAEHGLMIAEAMKRACNNPNIGYSQSERLQVVTFGTASTKKINADCSALVRRCVIEATGKDPGDFTTYNEAAALMNTGLFDKVGSVNKSSMLCAGDILVTRTKGHTVIVTEGLSRSNASTGSDTAMTYVTGHTYTTKVALFVRRKANGEKMKFEEMTKDGQKNGIKGDDGSAIIKQNIRVTCKASKTIGPSTWIQIPSGWICAVSSTGKVYVS